MSLLINEDERPRTERPIYWTGRVAIGLRVGEHRMPHAANDDETAMQDIVRGFRPAYLPQRTKRRDWADIGHRLVPWVCFGCVVVLALVLVFGGKP